VRLAERGAELEAVVVTSTRGERRVEDTPLRVEVIDEEEVAEKVAMTPGDIAMMLNETSGLRVQTTNPSLGGANVRIQGLRGRYSLLLADGLPLYGGQAGGLGLLQIPPVDLGRVEVIKGTASALYGSSALGGVVNLVSRRPGANARARARQPDLARRHRRRAFLAGPLSARWGYTLLAGAHRQRQNDLDGDGWTDMPGYERVVVRPRFYLDDGAGRTAFLTGGVTAEDRERRHARRPRAPGRRRLRRGAPHAARRRGRARALGGPDSGALAGAGPCTGRSSPCAAPRSSSATRTASARCARTTGTAPGSARRRSRCRAVRRRPVTYVAGAAVQRDAYRNADVAGFDYAYTVPAAFAQLDVDPAAWLSLSASARVDAHSAYGTFVNPRVSALLRAGRHPRGRALAGWTTRLSAGTGAFAPTPFTEETEATGLTPLAPLAGLAAERARSASLDVGGPVATALGRLEVNATAFGSRIARPLQVVDAPGVTAAGARRIALANAPAPTRTWGGELLARLVHPLGAEVPGGEEPPSLRVTGTYTHLRSTECDPDARPPAAPRRLRAARGAADAAAAGEVDRERRAAGLRRLHVEAAVVRAGRCARRCRAPGRGSRSAPGPPRRGRPPRPHRVEDPVELLGRDHRPAVVHRDPDLLRSVPPTSTVTGVPSAPCCTALPIRLPSAWLRRAASHRPAAPRGCRPDRTLRVARRDLVDDVAHDLAQVHSARATGMPPPRRLRVKSSRSPTIVTERLALPAMRAVSVRCGSSSSPVSSMNAADVWIAPSGVRRSCPRMARKVSFACSTSWLKRSTDSASAWSMASLKRVRSSMSDASSAPSARVQRRITLARRARYSATICATVNPLWARPVPCSSAAVRASGSSARARPFDFSAWANRPWGVARSAAITVSIASAWSRSAATSIGPLAGAQVRANASHSARIGSGWSG
jgi:outer membrane receptor for ferrienterochelin and colicins